MERVAIATNEIGMHVIVRLLPRTREGDAGCAFVSMGALNALLSAKKPRELAVATTDLPALFPVGAEPLKGRGTLRYSLDGALASPETLGLSGVGPELLQYEAQFDANTALEDSLPAAKSAARGCPFSFDWLRAASDGLDPDEFDVAVESFADWAFVRNVTGITAKLLALIASGENEPMARAGFELRESGALGGELWMLPFAYNPFFAPMRPNLSSLAAKLGDYSDYQPLMSATTRIEKVPRRGGALRSMTETVLARCFGAEGLGGGRAVFLLTAPVASQDYISLLGGWRTATERRYMLCTLANESEPYVARRVASALIDSVAACRLQTKDGATVDMGWSECAQTRFENPPSLTMRAHSVLADVMYQIVYRGSNRIAICSNCGCAIIQSKKGPLKEWCGAACRMSMTRRIAKASL